MSQLDWLIFRARIEWGGGGLKIMRFTCFPSFILCHDEVTLLALRRSVSPLVRGQNKNSFSFNRAHYDLNNLLIRKKTDQLWIIAGRIPPSDLQLDAGHDLQAGMETFEL